MRILMKEDIDIYSTTHEPVAILPEDNNDLYKALCKNLDEEKANAILKDGVWFSNNRCVSFYVEFVEDWRI